MFALCFSLCPLYSPSLPGVDVVLLEFFASNPFSLKFPPFFFLVRWILHQVQIHENLYSLFAFTLLVFLGVFSSPTSCDLWVWQTCADSQTPKYPNLDPRFEPTTRWVVRLDRHFCVILAFVSGEHRPIAMAALYGDQGQRCKGTVEKRAVESPP